MDSSLVQPVVIGAGPVGMSVVGRLVARSLTPRLLTRRGTKADGALALAVDATNASMVSEAIADADVVFQCAQPPYHQWAEHFPRLQRSLLDACARSGSTLIAVENLYGYGITGQVMTEQSPYKPTTKKGEVRAAMSRELTQHHQDGLVRTAAMRASDFIGPGVTESAYAARFFGRLARRKTADILGDPHTRHSVTYVPDLAEAVVRVAEAPQAWGRAWHAPTAPR